MSNPKKLSNISFFSHFTCYFIMGFSFSFRDFMYDSLITVPNPFSIQIHFWPHSCFQTVAKLTVKGCWTTSPRTLQGCAKWQCAFFGASNKSHRGFAVLWLWRKRVGSDHYCLYDDVVSLGRKEARCVIHSVGVKRKGKAKQAAAAAGDAARRKCGTM